MVQKGILDLPDEDLERQMYHKSIDILKDNGYSQYEISNFSKKGKECLHNLTYWNIKPYLGVGLSSHSNLLGKRFWNHSSMNKYNQLLDKGSLPIEGEEVINAEMEISEYCILGLRLIRGIDKEHFRQRFGFGIEGKFKDIINKHKINGLLKEDLKTISLTQKGLDLSNLVEVDFMP